MKYLFIFEAEELGIPFSMRIQNVKKHEAPYDVLEEGEEYSCVVAIPLHKFQRELNKLINKQEG